MPLQVLQQTINDMVDSVCGILAVDKSSPIIAFLPARVTVRNTLHFMVKYI
jgi:hypothetical protein